MDKNDDFWRKFMAGRNESITKGSKVKKKYVAKNHAKTETSRQKARTVKPNNLKEWFGRLKEALKINRKQGENSRRQETKKQEEVSRKRENDRRTQNSRRNERLAAEKEARDKLAKENKKARDKEKKEISNIEAKSEKVDQDIKGLSSRHESNNARREKLDALRQRVRKRDELRKQDENDQTMVLDWSQKNNKGVEKADGEVRAVQKEAEKKVEEVKNKTEKLNKQVKNNDIARLSGRSQEIIDNKLNEIDAPTKGQNKDKTKSKESEKLSHEEIKMLQMGINPRDKAQVTRYEAEKNQAHHSENEQANSQQYQNTVGRVQRSIGD